MMRPSIAVMVAVALLLLGVDRSAAEQAAEVTYEGTHEAGGILHLTLSAAGDRITAMDVDGIAGGGCSWDLIDLSNWGGSIGVTDGHFEATNPDGDRFGGRFTPPNQAEGTILVHDPVKGCETPPLRWVAQAQG